jgi:hypothetical protein
VEPASSINRLQAYLRHGAQQQSQTWYRWAMEYHALHKDGVELTLELRSEAHVVLRVVDHSDDLTDACGIDEAWPLDTMPEDDLPATTRFADATFVGGSFDLTEGPK